MTEVPIRYYDPTPGLHPDAKPNGPDDRSRAPVCPICSKRGWCPCGNQYSQFSELYKKRTGQTVPTSNEEQ